MLVIRAPDGAGYGCPPPGGQRISIVRDAELGGVLPMFNASALNAAAAAVTN